MKNDNSYNPKVLIILPVKGVDLDLDKNLLSLKNQSYINFEIIGVVDSKDDPSVHHLDSVGIKYILSDYNCKHCSGKVRAISTALKKFGGFDIYIIADSDIRVENEWLRKLILPLSNDHIGISTTFPKFYPEGGFWSKVKMVWGLVGESMMSSNLTRFAWGGSLAFRRDLIDNEFILSFGENISDDIALLIRAKEMGKIIYYEKNARVIIHSNDNFSKFLEWSNRQTALSITGSKKVFIFGMIYFSSVILIILSSIFLSILYSPLFSIFLIIPLMISFSNFIKVPKKTFLVIPITFMLFFLYVLNLLIGFSKNEIEWRGVRYPLK